VAETQQQHGPVAKLHGENPERLSG
jgi:hypothetical protein